MKLTAHLQLMLRGTYGDYLNSAICILVFNAGASLHLGLSRIILNSSYVTKSNYCILFLSTHIMGIESLCSVLYTIYFVTCFEKCGITEKFRSEIGCTMHRIHTDLLKSVLKFCHLIFPALAVCGKFL